MADAILTLARLLTVLNYNPLTGIFTWLVRTAQRVHVGDVAGCKNGHGYVYISVAGKQYPAHRLAWFYVYGVWPPHDIDHIDMDPLNNAISNLRLATRGENEQNRRGANHNSKSGIRGVWWNKRLKKWIPQIGVGGKVMHLGCFSKVEDAVAARRAAELKYHPFASSTPRISRG